MALNGPSVVTFNTPSLTVRRTRAWNALEYALGLQKASTKIPSALKVCRYSILCHRWGRSAFSFSLNVFKREVMASSSPFAASKVKGDAIAVSPKWNVMDEDVLQAGHHKRCHKNDAQGSGPVKRKNTDKMFRVTGGQAA